MKRNILLICSAGIAVILIAAAEYKAAFNFGENEKAIAANLNRPSVTFTRPAAGESSVLPNTFVSCDVNLPNPGHGIDAETMNAQTVRLMRERDGKIIEARMNTSGAGDAIVCQPVDLLESSTQYAFEVSASLCDTSGAHFAPSKMNFTTAAGAAMSEFPVAFAKVLMPETRVLIPGTDRPSAYTALTFGPDGRRSYEDSNSYCRLGNVTCRYRGRISNGCQRCQFRDHRRPHAADDYQLYGRKSGLTVGFHF